MRNTIIICAFFVLFAFANAETLTKARLRGMSALEKDLKSESSFLAVNVLHIILTILSLRTLLSETTSSP